MANDQPPEMEDDFASMLEAFDEIAAPKTGDSLQGVVVEVTGAGLVVDLGLKRDGFVPRSDLERLSEPVEFSPGDDIAVVVITPRGHDGSMIVSYHQARQVQDWARAEKMLESGELWQGTVAGYNRGGLLVPFGDLSGFIPASHIVDLPRGLSEQERHTSMAQLVGQEMGLRVIEVNRTRRRLVLSQREAQREWRERQRAELMATLSEGQVLTGTITGLRDFGAFVDLGGVDGLVHVSELAWQRVQHPNELVAIGDEVEVMIIKIDNERNRIGLSIKRLQPDPWETVGEQLEVGQEVTGQVTHLTPFGVFVDIGGGVEGLLHKSEIPPGMEARIGVGQVLTLQIVSVDSDRQRIGLSLVELPGQPDEGVPDNEFGPQDE